MTDRRVYVEALVNIVTSIAVCAGSLYAVQYFLRNPEQERANEIAKRKLEVLWASLGRQGLPPEFNEFELAILKDVLLPHEISVSLDDIGGLDNIKSTLWETVLLPFVEPNVFASEDSLDDGSGHNLLSAPLGVLFYGPPGTGKTMMAKAVAKSTNAVFIPLDFSTMYNKYLGESEKLAKALFSLAKKLSPTIIFIDEVDVFLRKRGNSNEHEAVSMMKGQFMTLWDGMTSDSRSQVMVMGATNRPYDLDEAILRRLPRQILFGLPETREREAILRVLLAKSIIAPEEEAILYGWVARKTADYSGSDLKELCKCAAMQPMRDFAKTYRPSNSSWGSVGASPSFAGIKTAKPKPRPITLQDFVVAMEQVKPTGREALDHLQRFYASQLVNNPFMSAASNSTSSSGAKNNSNKAAAAKKPKKAATPGSVAKKPTVNQDIDIDFDSALLSSPLLNLNQLQGGEHAEKTIDTLIAQLEAIKSKIRTTKQSSTKVEEVDNASDFDNELEFELDMDEM